jgi:hypothetical protein
MQLTKEASRGVTVLWACWRVLTRVGVRSEFGARFGARYGTLPMENLGAEALWFGGEGRNRTDARIL